MTRVFCDACGKGMDLESGLHARLVFEQRPILRQQNFMKDIRGELCPDCAVQVERAILASLRECKKEAT